MGDGKHWRSEEGQSGYIQPRTGLMLPAVSWLPLLLDMEVSILPQRAISKLATASPQPKNSKQQPLIIINL